MLRYLISFDHGAMTFPEEDLPEVERASREVVREAKEAGVWIFGAGLDIREATVVDTGGTVTVRPYRSGEKHIGGFSIIEVASHDEALKWAAKIAVSCRCAQEVRELMYDPES
jgi:hypothetical protein